MKCPFCGDQESKVVDSRHSEDGLSIRRRRECLNCQRRFTTYEIVESLPIIVVKRDGSRQGFDRNKILNSMVRAFDKRQVEMAELDRITTEIEQAVQNTLERDLWMKLPIFALPLYIAVSRTYRVSSMRSIPFWKKNKESPLWIKLWT